MPIFDQGYQHWSGSLSGHTWRWLTITRHGVRVGMKNIFLRILVIVSWLPAVGLAFMVNAVIQSHHGEDRRNLLLSHVTLPANLAGDVDESDDDAPEDEITPQTPDEDGSVVQLDV